MRNASRKIIAIVIAYVLLGPHLAASFHPRSRIQGNLLQEPSQSGLNIVQINSPQGRVVVSLPDVMRAGDTVSGTVSHEATDDNSKASTYVIEVEGNKPTPIAEKMIKLIV